MRVADYIANFIADVSPRVYGVCGAGAMHLNDAIANHPGIKVITMQNEQAAAMAAEADARVTGRPSFVMVTAGPGGTNALTGVACAYVDSIPMFIIAGQVTTNTMIGESGTRQIGMNELDMVSIMRPVTKFADTVRDPNYIGYALFDAYSAMMKGRRGPVFLEIPLDVQAAECSGVNPSPLLEEERPDHYSNIPEVIRQASKPLVIIGNGVRLAGACYEFMRVFGNVNSSIPVVSSWGATDIMPTDHPCYIGRCGIFGDRASNFAAQTADLILVIGSRLTVAQTGHAREKFAPNAMKIVVDIDQNEVFNKPEIHANNRIDVGIVSDAKEFLRRLPDRMSVSHSAERWLRHCQSMKEAYQQQRRLPLKGISSYGFVEALSDHMPDKAIVVTDVGFCFIPTMQTMRLRLGQRLIHSGGVSPMGWGIPAAIGAAFTNAGPVICLTGDGGAMMNLQELQTIYHHRLPMAIFVFENDGYATMKIAQNNHFKREVMAGPTSGLSLPDFTKVAKAFGITTMEFNSLNALNHAMETILDVASLSPIVIVMHMDREELISPRVVARMMEDGKFVATDIADMWPYLPREEFASNMNPEGVSANVVERFDEHGQKVLGTD